MTDLLHQDETPDEPIHATADTTDLDELRALRARQAAKRADADAEIAQLEKRIATRKAADAAGEIEILTEEEVDTPGDSAVPVMLACPVPTDSNHFCRIHVPPNPFCNSRHPTESEVWCRRMSGHDGDHAAHTYLISAPETWPATVHEPTSPPSVTA